MITNFVFMETPSGDAAIVFKGSKGDRLINVVVIRRSYGLFLRIGNNETKVGLTEIDFKKTQLLDKIYLGVLGEKEGSESFVLASIVSSD